MADWTKSMQQTYEYYLVDPDTWNNTARLDMVKSATIDRDSSVETLGSAIIDIAESIGECYVRAYLVTIQNGVTERHPLGTFLVQTPYTSFDGKKKVVSVDAYTPLLELKENQPPIGYSLLKGKNIMDTAYMLVREKMRGPVVETVCDINLQDDFVAEPDEHWLSFLRAFISNADYEFGLDEMGRTIFLPKQDAASLQPVWTYDDGNCSIIQPDIDINHDLYGLPNVVEVVYSNGGTTYSARVVNNDKNSPISTVNRGREITYRDTNPSIIGNPTQAQVNEYAKQLLRDLSSLEYTITYTHGYNGVRIGDCVRFNHVGADLVDVKAKVISQSIKCTPGCQVKEKAVYTKKLWG